MSVNHPDHAPSRGPLLKLDTRRSPPLQLRPLPGDAGTASQNSAFAFAVALLAFGLLALAIGGGMWAARGTVPQLSTNLLFDRLIARVREAPTNRGSASQERASTAQQTIPNSASPAASAGADTKVVLLNGSPEAITEIRLSSVREDKWGSDLLGNDVLAPGGEFVLEPDSAGGCQYDVQVTYASGKSQERRNVDFCRISNISFDGG